MDHIAGLGEIEAAYRLILGREPDLAGFDSYRERGMTLGELRNEFLRSEEFRARTGFTLPMMVDIGGIILSLDANEPEFGRQIVEHRHWEPHLVEVLKQNLQPGHAFVDIGANIGAMAFQAAAMVGIGGRVLAFEPLAENIQNFTKGVAANDLLNVRLYPFALSAERGTFAIEGSSNGYLAASGANERQVLALRGDDILADEPRIDFIKIDVEGHEPHVLDGLAATIDRHHPKILCEFNPRCLRDHIGREPHDFADQLFRMASQIKTIDWDGSIETARSPDDLMAIWGRQDAAAQLSGRLPAGMAHLDLLLAA